jgi:hypothetical protein
MTRWTGAQIAYLHKYYATDAWEMLLKALPHSAESIRWKARTLGLTRGDGLPGRPSQAAKVESVLRNFPGLPRKRQAELAGVSERTVSKFANKLGINRKRAGRP